MNSQDEFAALLVALGDGVGHAVEGFGQIADLVLSVAHVDAHIQLAHTELTGGGSDLLHGFGLVHTGHRTDNGGDENDGAGGQHKDGGQFAPHIADVSGVAGHQYQTLQIAVFIGNGQTNQIAGVVVKAVQRGQSGVAAVHDVGHHGLGQDFVFRYDRGLSAVGDIQHLSLVGGQHDVGIGQQGHVGQIGLEGGAHPGCAVLTGVEIVGGVGGDIAGIAAQRLLTLADDVAVAQRGKGGAQQQKRQQDHARHGGELTAVYAFHWVTTSNL